MRTVVILVALVLFVGDAGSKPQTGSVTGTVTLKGTKGTQKGVVIYLEDVPGTPSVPKNHAIIRQREKQFEPPLTVVVRGTTIDFPNEDKIFHNVFSVSRPARFDLGLYKSGTAKSVEFKRSGVVDVYCNIHPEMIAKVKILENGFYTVSDAKGAFRIDGVPEGTFPVVAWLPSGDEAKGSVTVKAGASAEVKLELSETVKKETHTRKDGTPYGRYK
jgi:plastocyanin